MAREKGSVRIGPVSVFALVVILGLAVLAVLSAATAQASHTEAQAQADFTRSSYVNDAAAAQALADIDAALADAALAQEAAAADADSVLARETTAADADGRGDASACDIDAAMSAVSAVLPQGQVADGCAAESFVDGTAVRMTFSTEDGRTLDVELAVRDDLTYSLERWVVTTAWNQEPEETKLWQSG